MALYNRAGVKITYNQHFDRLAITVGDEFVSVSISIFKMWMKLCELDTEFEKFSMEQNGGKVEVLKMCGNISLKFISCKNFCSQLLIKKDTVRNIFEQQHRILNCNRKNHDGKRSVGPQPKHHKCILPNNKFALGMSRQCFKIGTAVKESPQYGDVQPSLEKLPRAENSIAPGPETVLENCNNSMTNTFCSTAEL